MQIYFNLLIRIVFVAYLKIVISGIVQIGLWRRGKSDPTHEPVLYVGIGICGVALMLPLLAIYLLKVNRNQLATKFVYTKIGNLYNGIHLYRHNWAVFYTPTFLFRRLIFCALPVFLYMMPFLQVQLLLLLTSFYVIFYAGVKPHAEKSRVSLEIFNECMIMILNYHVVSFSPFNLHASSKFQMGYSYLIVIGVTIVFNMWVMINKLITKKSREGKLVLIRKLKELRYKELGIRRLKDEEENNPSSLTSLNSGRILKKRSAKSLLNL